jgi:hypothetical protein
MKILVDEKTEWVQARAEFLQGFTICFHAVSHWFSRRA